MAQIKCNAVAGAWVGGMKASSYGPREQGRYAVEFYTQAKTSDVSAGAPE